MRIQTTPLGRNIFKRSVAIITAALFLFAGLPNYIPQAFAKPANDIQVRGGNPSENLSRLIRDEEIRIPPELGLIDESFHGVSGKTVLYIQDAHDSLEAQENIAKIINHLVSGYGVRTVFEEGYEGPVPTDKYFGFIKDPKIKEKVAYFLMDHLRVGGAEYAHINRHSRLDHRLEATDHSQNTKMSSPNALIGDPELDSRLRGNDGSGDWQLIGADSIKLHKENINQYRLSATKKDAITKDIKALEKELKSLVDSRFPKELKEWLKTKKQFDAKKLDLLAYLGRTMPLLGEHGAEKGLGLISFLLEAMKTNNPTVIEKAKHIDAREVFGELIKLEQAVSETFLHDMADKQLFDYCKILSLLNRLNDLQVSQEEYEAVKASLKAFDTESFAQFIFSQAPKALILSRMWERNIKEAVRFYEIAVARDSAISDAFGKYFSGKRNEVVAQDTAVLVYGGFHKENIKRILETKGISYLVISPRITKPSLRHEGYYKRLMTDGRLSYELPANLRRATRSESRIEIWGENVGLARTELRIMASIARDMPNADSQSLGLAVERALGTFANSSTVRSEAREKTKRTEGWFPGNDAEGIRVAPADYEEVSRSIRQQNRKPRVLLVQSYITGLNNSNPPLGLYYLKSSLREHADAEVVILDLGVGPQNTNSEREAHLREVLQEFQPDMVGISFATASSSNAFKAGQIVKEFNSHTIVIAGGPHSSAVSSRDLLKELPFDVSFRQEGERSLCGFVNAIHRSGRKEDIFGVKGFAIKYVDGIFDTGNPDVIQDIDSLPFPAIPPEDMALYDVWIVNPANKAVPILTTRGCPYGCVFCSKGVFGRSLRKRSPENIIAEMKGYYQQGVRNFSFIDDGFSSNPKWLMELCRAITASGMDDVRWRASIRTNTMTPDLLRIMKRSGCIGVAFGIESGSDRILKTVIGKGTTVETNLKSIRMAKEAGIEEVRLFIMLGLPGETEWDVRQTIEFVKRADPTNIGLSVAVPMPGSRWAENLEDYGTTIVGRADDFYPYQKVGATGKYTADVPPIVHRTDELSQKQIAHLYGVMRIELAEYMFEPEDVKAKFVASEFAYGIGMLRKIGLGDLLEAHHLTAVNIREKFAPMVNMILMKYAKWRKLNRVPSAVGDELSAKEVAETLDRENILGLIFMHLLSLILDGEHDENLIAEMLFHGGAAPNPLLHIIGALAKIAHGAFLLVEGKISREEYDQLVAAHIDKVHVPPLQAIAEKLKNIAYLKKRENLTRLLGEADDSNRMNGEDLLLISLEGDTDTAQTEGVMWLKSPTSVGLDGRLNLPLMDAIFERIERFGCAVAGMRIFSGAYFQQHPEKLNKFYGSAYDGFSEGVADPLALAKIKEIYGVPDFKRVFGVPFAEVPIVPGRELIERYGLREDELDVLWSGSRFPISISDFQKRFGIKVRIVENQDAVAVPAGEIAISRKMIVVEHGIEKIDWYGKGVPYGVNKVGSSTSVFPIEDPRLNHGRPVLVVNGYIPGLFDAFRADDKKSVALMIRSRPGVKVSFKKLREELMGDDNMPDKNPKGTLRRDAIDGVLPVPEEMRPVLRGVTNLAHLSAGPLEGLKEICLLFDRPAEQRAFGRQLLKAGYSTDQIQYLFTDPKVRVVRDGAAQVHTIFELTSKLSNTEALEMIMRYFPPYRIDSPSATPSVSFEQHQRIIEGKPSLSSNRLQLNQIRPSSYPLTDIRQLSHAESLEDERVGDELIRKGEVAVIIGAGGEGGRLVGYDVDDPRLRDKVAPVI